MKDTKATGGNPETALIKATESEARSPVVLQLGNTDAGAGGFSFGLLLKSLRQRLLLTIPLGIILSASACAALWHFTEDKFLAQSTLEIQDRQPFIAFPTHENSNLQNFSQTQVELLKEPYIVGKAVETDNLLDVPELSKIKNEVDPIVWITQRLKVTQVGKSLLYRVSFVTTYPETAQKVVAAIVKVYKNYQESESNEQRHRILGLLKDEQTIREKDIAIKRENLRALVKEAGGETLATNPAAAAATAARGSVLDALTKKLIDAEVDIELGKAALALLKERSDKPVEVAHAEVESAVEDEPQIVQLKRQLKELQSTINGRSEDSLPVKEAKKKLPGVEKKLADSTEQLRKQHRERLTLAASTGVRNGVEKVEEQLENQNKAADLIRQKIMDERRLNTKQGDKSLEIEFARDELERSEEVSQRISNRILQLQTESRALDRVKVVAEAKVPQFPEGPSLAKKLAMVGFAGFLAPMALFVGWDLLYRRVYEREQLQQEVKVKFVSEVAALPIRSLLPRPGSTKEFRHQSLMFEESVNALRTTLSVDKTLNGAQVFVMASAVSGEGKTNLSSQLAMSWSQAEPGKVILVDADLRSPNVHDLFEVRQGPGLAEVLRGECSLEDATIMDWGDRLYILPAGDLGSDSASRLFSGSAFSEVVAKLRSQYTKVMIDVPPVLMASETLLIAKEADGVLMCALHDYSRTGQVKQAYDRLAHAGVNIVGAVLNGAPVRQYSYNYRGYGVS